MTGAKVTLRSWRRILALGLAAGMAATAIPLQLMAAQETVQESQTTGSVTEGYASERIDNGYAKISAGYALPEYTGGGIMVPQTNCKDRYTAVIYFLDFLNDGNTVCRVSGTV